MKRKKATTLAERYDRGLSWIFTRPPCAGKPHPMPTSYWPKGNIEFLEEYRDWLLGGGVSELVVRTYHIPMAGHVLGLTLLPYHQLNPETDLACALEYIQAKGVSASWLRNCKNSLSTFRRYLRLKKGLGEEIRHKPFNALDHSQGLPAWVIQELEKYKRQMQRNWREARMDLNTRGFWNKHRQVWRFLCQERAVNQLADLKRQFVLDYVDTRLTKGICVKSVNAELRYFRGFLHFLEEQGYAVPHSLFLIRGLKEPDPLPRHLTDQQVKIIREEVERKVLEARFPSRLRMALLVRAAFYLLWQGGLRLGEVEELRLEDLDLQHKRISVRDGKGRKDRTVYLADTAISTLQEYLAVRGDGSDENVFLFRNAPLKKDLIHFHLKIIGDKVGVKVYPHRLRHTCATQLLNAGCRITSIQRFLGHKELSSTMIYARAHDQTVADDYFSAMSRIEHRLEIVPPAPDHRKTAEIADFQPSSQLSTWLERLALPRISPKERLDIVSRLKLVISPESISRQSQPLAITG